MIAIRNHLSTNIRMNSAQRPARTGAAKALSRHLCFLGATLTMMSAHSGAQAAIVSSSGNAVISSTPLSSLNFVSGQVEADVVLGFDEASSVHVTESMLVCADHLVDASSIGVVQTGVNNDGTVPPCYPLPPGHYSSHILRFDPVNDSGPTLSVTNGTFDFDGEIVAIMATNEHQSESDDLFGTALSYDINEWRGLEGNDTYLLESLYRLTIVQLQLTAGRVDDLRVITRAPEPDSDGDGVPDGFDLCNGNDASGDTDHDGTCNDLDECPFDAENDIEGDGICADVDNCPLDANENQSDLDLDGIGDLCDDDDDNDGVLDTIDNCPITFNPDQLDADHDLAGNVCDADDDGDGVSDDVDACPNTLPGDFAGLDGCSLPQLCPCDADWRNHGSYTSCVAHATSAWVEQGLITEQEKGAIVSEAGRSSCGKSKKK